MQETIEELSNIELLLLERVEIVVGVRPEPVPEVEQWGTFTMQAIEDDIFILWANANVLVISGFDTTPWIGRSVNDIPEMAKIFHSRYGIHIKELIKCGGTGSIKGVHANLGVMEIRVFPVGERTSTVAYRYERYYNVNEVFEISLE